LSERLGGVWASVVVLAWGAMAGVTAARPQVRSAAANDVVTSRPLPTLRLKIGVIPFDVPQTGADPASDPFLNDYFAEVTRQFGSRGVNVEITPVAGNYYQIVHWMREGMIDGAIVSSFTTYLLTTDGRLSTFPVVEFSRNVPTPNANPLRGVPTIVTARRNGRLMGNDGKALTQCLEAALASLSDPAIAKACELRFVSHLSSTGFVLPVMHIGEFAATKPIKDPAAFWARVMEWSRFDLWHHTATEDAKDIPVIRFTYAGAKEPGEELRLRTTVPHLNDALLLADRGSRDARLLRRISDSE
jgi:hypothetical protein